MLKCSFSQQKTSGRDGRGEELFSLRGYHWESDRAPLVTNWTCVFLFVWLVSVFSFYWEGNKGRGGPGRMRK